MDYKETRETARKLLELCVLYLWHRLAYLELSNFHKPNWIVDSQEKLEALVGANITWNHNRLFHQSLSSASKVEEVTTLFQKLVPMIGNMKWEFLFEDSAPEEVQPRYALRISILNYCGSIVFSDEDTHEVIMIVDLKGPHGIDIAQYKHRFTNVRFWRTIGVGPFEGWDQHLGENKL